VLNVSINPIGDDEISLIVDHLHGNTTLTELSVYHCGLSDKGTISCKMQCCTAYSVYGDVNFQISEVDLLIIFFNSTTDYVTV